MAVCCLSTVLVYLFALIFLHPYQVLHWQALSSIKKVQCGGDDYRCQHLSNTDHGLGEGLLPLDVLKRR